MRKPITDSVHDWSNFATRGETESGIRAVCPVEIVDDSANQDDIDTLRMIEVALEYVESEHDSGHDIAVCSAPESVGRSRSEIPCASIFDDGDELDD